MKVTFLGTGTSQGIPIIGSNHPVCLSDDQRDKRLRSSIMLNWDDYCYIIDCGPDFRQQMLREGVTDINGILFTHEHADHTAGLDDIRPFTHKMGNVPLYFPARIVDGIKQRFHYIFTNFDRYPGAPQGDIIPLTNTPFILGEKTIQPVEYLHGVLPIFGYRIDNFAYLTDFKTISEDEIVKLQALDVLVLSTLRIAPHPTHVNLKEALAMIERLQPKRTYLTHISHLLGFHAEVSELLPDNVFLAYDGLVLEV